MKKLGILFIVLLFISGGNLKSQTSRFIFTSDFMGVRSNDTRFGYFLPTSKRFYPSFRYMRSHEVGDLEDAVVALNWSNGFTFSGFKYTYNPDSIFFRKIPSLETMLALSANFSDYEFEEIPLSFTVFSGVFIQYRILTLDYYNQSKIPSVDIFENLPFDYGLCFGISYDFFPDSDYSLEVFYLGNIGMNEMKPSINLEYKYITHSIGLAFKIVTD